MKTICLVPDQGNQSSRVGEPKFQTSGTKVPLVWNYCVFTYIVRFLWSGTWVPLVWNLGSSTLEPGFLYSGTWVPLLWNDDLGFFIIGWSRCCCDG